MKSKLFHYILFSNLILLVFPLVQKWNLEKSSIDLLASSESITVTEFEQTKGNVFVQLNKTISKENGEINYVKRIKMYQNGNLIYNSLVDFDKIDSFYYFNSNSIIVCPKGKYHPLNYFTYSLNSMNIPNFQEKGDLELKCYYHQSQNFQYLLVFYLMNSDYHFSYKNLQTN